MDSKEKNKILRKKLAGFIRTDWVRDKFEDEKKEKIDLENMRRSNFYRTRITDPSELISPIDEKHRKKIRKQEEALGIKVLV